MGKVLFIDDNIEDFKPLLTIITKLIKDLEIITADNGYDGLEIANEKNPDVIFLDINMPGIDGYEVCKRLKAAPQTNNIPIVFFTSAELDLAGQMSAIDTGGEDFIHKPINAVELAARIKIMLKLKAHTDNLEQLVAEQTKKADEQRALAARAERLASLGTLAAGIAHEINQPLNALKVSVDGALYWKGQNRDISSDELFESFEFISEQANRIDNIIRHIRSLAKRENPSLRTTVRINEVIDSALSLIEKQITSHKIEIIKHFEVNLPLILAHSTQMEQVIINLIINAKNALDSLDRDGKRIEVWTTVQNDFCVLEIRDNGPGIPENMLEKIFDPFYTSKFGEEGMG